MKTHRPAVGASDEWYTPLEIFQALNTEFDLDPCSPSPTHWVPAQSVFTKEHDGLSRDWWGLVFMNPPFGGRNGHVPWLRKFFEHGNGIAIVTARTSAGWFHDWTPKAETMVFPRGKTKFVRPDGSVGKAPHDGIALLGIGDAANRALRNCDLGMCWERPK